ncbi:MAG: SPOR domain-containing protein [Candidatus Eisenbacteria bacterium]
MLHSQFRLAARLAAVLFLLASIAPARAQDEPAEPDRENLLSGLKNVLSFRSPAEAYQAALRVPSADLALPAMKNLAENKGDAETATRAAIWVGLYYYGAGATRDALGWFESAAKAGGEGVEQARARFWSEQCRNLLEDEGQESSAVRGGASTVPDVLAGLAVGDQELRHGKTNAALRRYLALEGDAARLGCLGPVYYRVALVLATAPSAAEGLGIDPNSLRGWEARTALSPERALAAAFEATGDVAPAAADSTKASDTAREDEEDTEAPPAAGSAEAGTPDQAREAAPPSTEARAVYSIQLGAFRDRDRARAEMERLTLRGLSVRLDHESDASGDWYRIRVGRESSREAAAALADRVCQGLDHSIVKLESGGSSAP